MVQTKRSILLGYFTTHSTTNDDLNSDSLILSPVSQNVENITQGEISKKIRLQWRNLSKPERQISIFSFIHEKEILRSLFPASEEMALVELGHFDASEENDINLKLENIRKNIRRSCSALCQNFSVSHIDIDISDYPKVAAESAVYGIFNRNEIVCKFPKYSYFYDQDSKLLPVSIRPLVGQNISDPSEESMKAFEEGLIIGECQNFARYLHGAVSYISRSEYLQYVKEKFSSFDSVKLNIRDEDWIQSMQMKSIQQVSSMNRRSTEQGKFYDCFYTFPCLLEIHYESCSKSQPIVLVGRSSFYNSSNSFFVTENRQPVHLIQNISGGASIMGSILALARLKIPVKVIGIIVLCDHSFCWRKASSMNTASYYDIFSEVPNSHEERLILKDAVSYACSFEPKLVLTVATQTNYLTEAFLDYASALYSTDDSLAELFLKVSSDTGERFIRLPFVDIEDDVFEKCVIMKQFCSDCREVLNGPIPPDIRHELTDYISKNWDFCFITSCCLKDLLKEQKWIHLELNKGLLIDKNSEDEVFEMYEVTGAPTRSFIYFIQNLANIKDVST